jgi:hypothetical protein
MPYVMSPSLRKHPGRRAAKTRFFLIWDLLMLMYRIDNNCSIHHIPVQWITRIIARLRYKNSFAIFGGLERSSDILFGIVVLRAMARDFLSVEVNLRDFLFVDDGD